MTEPGQVKFQVHHVRFFEYQPQAISCISRDGSSQRVAVCRSNGHIEILNTKHNWIQEITLIGQPSTEALIWCKGRLFAGGSHGNLQELDLGSRSAKHTVSSNAGPIWCLTKNSTEDQIAAGTDDGCVVVFDVSEEPRFVTGFKKQEDKILSIAWYNRDDESVILTGGVNSIRQWSVKSGQPISRMTLGRKFHKDTIVWCLAVTRDFTVISGDSRGIVTFWNGKESTQLKTFHCHKADVLSLCLSDDETRVFTGGVDGAVYQFSLYAADPTSERKRWVHQPLHTRHTHDIKTVAYINGFLASGGVDTVMHVAKVQGRRSVCQLSPVPRPGLIQLAGESLIQLQYQDYLEVWHLGAASPPFAEARGILPLVRSRTKLLKLKARKGHEILCSAISSQSVIAFSDTKGIRLFQLHLTDSNSASPEVRLEHVECRLTHPAHCLTFTPDGSTLVAVLTTGSIQLMNMKVVQANLVLADISGSQVHRIATSPDNRHVAFATLDHGVHVYDVQSAQHVCSCPSLASQVSALAFSPHGPLLAIAYCSHAVCEFDVEKKEYSKWSRDNNGHFHKNWLKPVKHIMNMAYCPDNPDRILFHTDVALCVLDKSRVTPTENKQTGVAASMTPPFIQVCYKYKYLLFAGFTSSGSLVAVERLPSVIEEGLPPSFKHKKFGTS
ncbi:hypothetical protein BsWGS_13905 [Bradybaena similaris]